jgi:flagellar biosynthetic protein FlhB
MAEQPAGDRTEQPTPERLKKSRQEGKVPQSQEVPSALLVGALLVVCVLMAPAMYGWFCRHMHEGLSLQSAAPLDGNGFASLLRDKGTSMLWMLLPFVLAAGSISVLSSMVVGGWTFAPKAISLKWERLGFSNGFKNLISPKSLVIILTTLAKLGVLVAVTWLYLRGCWDEVLALTNTSAEGTLAGMCRLTMGLAARIVAALLAIAVLDFLYQRWIYIRDLRMTRQEVRDERKQHEVSPQVRSRIRRIQFQMAARRMLRAVPTADVVLANPTHVAVALKYDPGSMDAPRVVARGAELMCQRIKDIARGNNVPIVYRPELARSIYAAADVGESIPQTLFVAVAEVLAMIYRLRRRRLAAT